MWNGDARNYAHYRRQYQHQTNHYTGEIDARHTVQNDENICIGQLGKTQIQTGWEQKYQNLWMISKNKWIQLEFWLNNNSICSLNFCSALVRDQSVSSHCGRKSLGIDRNETHQLFDFLPRTHFYSFHQTFFRTNFSFGAILFTYLQIKVERRPWSRLMFRHRGNNWNVIFSIGWIQQRVKTTRPWWNFTYMSKYWNLNRFLKKDNFFGREELYGLPVMLRITPMAITAPATVTKTAFSKVSKYSFESRARTYSINAKIWHSPNTPRAYEKLDFYF